MSAKYKRKGRSGRLSYTHRKLSVNASNASKDLISLLKCSFTGAKIANNQLEGQLVVSLIDSDTKLLEPFLRGTISCSSSPIECRKTKADGVCGCCGHPCERYATVIEVCLTAEEDQCSACPGGERVHQVDVGGQTTGGVDKRKPKNTGYEAKKSQSKSLFSKSGRKIKVKRMESFVGFFDDGVDQDDSNMVHQKSDSDDPAEDVSDVDKSPISRKNLRKEFLKCKNCSKRFRLASSLQKHMQVHSGDGSASKKITKLQKPIKKDHELASKKCGICQLTFKKETTFLEHMKCIHQNSSVSEDEEHAVDSGSGKEAKEKAQLKAGHHESSTSTGTNQIVQESNQQGNQSTGNDYEDKHEEDTSLKGVGDESTKQHPYQCDECGKTFAMLPGLRSHKKKHTTLQFTCTICDKNFKTQDTLDYHMELHTGNRRFVCHTCNCRFTAKQKLDNHVRRIHLQEKPNQCGVCLKSFFQSHELQQHKLVHTGDKPHTCGVCDKKFLTRSQLQKHMVVHGQVRSNYCELCQMNFTVRRTYNNHIRTVHSNQKLHVCEFCGQSFQRSTQLKYHCLRHTGYEGFKCDQCGKQFRSQSYLRKHKALHTGENLITCGNCGKKFNDQWYFSKHQKHHCQSVRQECQLCGRSFTHAKDFQHHMDYHAGGRPHMCNQCGKAFIRIETYNDHVKRHTQEKCHVCTVCGKTFHRGSELRKHEARHRKVRKRGNFSNSQVGLIPEKTMEAIDQISLIPEKTMEAIEKHETSLEDEAVCSGNTVVESEDNERSQTIEYLVMDETGLQLDPKILHAILARTQEAEGASEHAGNEKPVGTLITDCGQDN